MKVFGIVRLPIAAVAAAVLAVAAAAAAGAASPPATGLVAAQAIVKAHSVGATQIAPKAKLNKKAPAGKTIIYIQSTAGAPLTIQQGDQMVKAAALLGWKIQRLNEDGTLAGVQAAITQALQLHPAGIVISDGIPPSYYADQVAQVKSQRVPLVIHATRISINQFPIVGGTGGDLLQGPVLAAELAADSKCNINVGYVAFQSIPVLKSFDDLVTAKLKSFCPNAKVTLIQNQLSDIGTRVSSNVVSALQADPSINYLTVDTGAFFGGVTAALQTAGLASRVKIIGTNPIQENIQAVKDGTQTAWVGVDSTWFAWPAIDSLARYYTGTKLVSEARAPEPIFVLTKATYPTDPAVNPVNGVKYSFMVKQYKQDWLLTK